MASKPEGIILVHAGDQQGPTGQAGKTIFGIWPNGLIRIISESEYLAWGKPEPDRVLTNGTDDREWDRLASYDRALRTGKGADIL
ncbi:MAG: hypothetical protein FIA97_18565 [Methylococcaceae bacterium]|nr:hypothetical protein [Methylococcaceae bacterium]